MKERFYIEGMHCASCAYRLQKHLKKIDGIKDASVNLASESVFIDYNPDIITLKSITRQIRNLGYEIIVPGTNSSKRQSFERKMRRKRIKRKLRKNQLIVALVFLAPLLAIGLSPLLHYPLPQPISYEYNPVSFCILQLILCAPIVFTGRRYFYLGWRKIFNLHPNVDSLVALGASASLIISFVSSAFVIFKGSSLENNPLYYMSAGAIIAMIMLGRYIENRSRSTSLHALEHLSTLIPLTCTLVTSDDTHKEVSPSSLKEGDIVSVPVNMIIPADGVIIKGVSKIEESIFSGNKTPVLKSTDDRVLAGMLNLENPIHIKIEKSGNETMLNSIIQMIEEGENSKPHLGRLADKVSAWAVPVGLALAFISAGLWYILNQNYEFAFNIFISVLVIACPVAIGLAIPLVILFATRGATTHGILIRRSNSLEAIKNADTFVFNLTGTLTEGVAVVTDIIRTGTMSEDDLLALTASAESLSKHPLAIGIVNKAKERNLQINTPDPVRLIEGEGIEAIVNDVRIDIGNYKLMKLINLPEEQISKGLAITRELALQGKTTVMIAIENQLEGIIAVADKPRPEAREVILKLEKLGKDVIILTGEHSSTALNIARQINVEHVIADVSSRNRARQIRKLQHENRKVVMIGDGFNDAGALAQANAGIAIGSADDIAADAADVVLLNRNLKLLLMLIHISRKSVRNMKENLFLTFIYNLIMLPIAGGILFLFDIHFLSDPLIAVIVMFLGSLSVIINASRLRKFKL